MKLRKKRKSARPKTKLGLPDLEHAKAAVVESLPSLGSKPEYGRSIDEFVAWYCSEPRLSFNKAEVMQFRMHLEERHLLQSMFDNMAAEGWGPEIMAGTGPTNSPLFAKRLLIRSCQRQHDFLLTVMNSGETNRTIRCGFVHAGR